MLKTLQVSGLIGVLIFASERGMSQGAAWDVRFAKTFSHRLHEIEQELGELKPLLEGLPTIPINNQGGTGGFASVHAGRVPQKNEQFAVEVNWGESRKVDCLALVPARRYDEKGLEALYGLPEDFRVQLIDAQGKVVALVAEERGSLRHPIRKGHPFFYEIQPAIAASGVRICAEKLQLNREDEESFVHAWSEVFAYEGAQELAQLARVKSLGGSASSAPWLWKPEYLVDGQTPLGLPEMPRKEITNVGWLSEGRQRSDEKVTLDLEFDQEVTPSAVRLVPAKRPTADLPSGFGFPKKIGIFVMRSGEEGEEVLAAESEITNPGHNPVLVPLKRASGNRLRIEVRESWKVFESFPAFVAFSEIEVLSGDQNLALGKVVRSQDGMLNIIGSGGRNWSIAALTDGYGPDGKLVSSREWVGKLDERLRIETRIFVLRGDAARVISGWRNAGLALFVCLGLAGAFAVVALPIRYRVHSNRELMKVRERIAGDLHDEVGSNLGSIQMFADLAEGRSGQSEELKRIQRIAAETVSAVRDIVWLLRPEGDHRIGPVEHLRETSSIMLEMLDWKFVADEASWQIEFSEETNRHLFLFFREALHNILRHAKASHVEITMETTSAHFRLKIKDDGVGISAERLQRASTLRALRQRALALNAEFRFESEVGNGTLLDLSLPLGGKKARMSGGVTRQAG